jgi:hypothetical protein
MPEFPDVPNYGTSGIVQSGVGADLPVEVNA